MPTVTDADLRRMREALFFDGPDVGRRLSRFWVLLVLAAVIASAGVVADSTATVIGAMIVAPLMTPILGTMLAVVTGDRANVARSVALVVGGSAAVVASAWLIGRAVPLDVVAGTSSQVAGRVNPRIIDLVAALATGAVGSFALTRDDVSDTLPGVAIAISLVPPLAVVGLTLEAGELGQAGGALLLFVTNVTAILFTGVVVMALYGVYGRASTTDDPLRRALNRRRATAVVVVLVAVVALPLGLSTFRATSQRLTTGEVAGVAGTWAAAAGWEVVSAEPRSSDVLIRAVGPLPAPDPQELRRRLDGAGLAGVDVRLELVPEQRVDLPGR